MVLALFVLSLVTLGAAAGSPTGNADGGDIVARTGPPRPSAGFSPLRLHPCTQYNEEVKYESLPQILGWPTDLSPEARCGVVTVQGNSRTMIVDGKPLAEHVTVDLNGDRDLANDTPVHFQPEDNLYAATVEFGQPVPLKFTAAPGADGSLDRVFLHEHTERQGEIMIGDRRLMFVLQGYRGRYDADHASVFFDFDGDGTVDTVQRSSDEHYRVAERRVTIGGVDYEFAVDAGGDTLTLRPSIETGAPRPRLDAGNPAPDFTFQDLAGETHRLSDYRGRVVLLYFWGTWCDSCSRDWPYLIETHARFKDQGFEILGINKADLKEIAEAYLRSHGITWPQTLQGDDGPILDLYRMDRAPTTFLIDQGGTIVDRQIRAEHLADRLGPLLSR
jgi:peroxiredoxin